MCAPERQIAHLNVPLRAIVAAVWLLPFALMGGPGVHAQQAAHIRATLLAEGPALPGQTVTMAVLMEPEAGWHGYWSNPGDAGLPLSLDWTLPAGAKAGDLQFPVPRTLVVQGLMNHVYEQAYAVLVPVTLPADARVGSTLAVSAKAQWLACTNQICVPERASLMGTITVGSGAKDGRFAAWRAALPARLDQPARFEATPAGLSLAVPFPASAAVDDPHFFIGAQGLVDYAAPQAFRRQGDWLIVDLARAKGALPEHPQSVSGVLALGPGAGGLAITATPGAVPKGGTPIGGSAKAAFSWGTLALAMLGALAGGLILNVMPCVFPILSLKAMALARGNSRHARAEGLAYSAGVILACLLLGAVLLALRAGGAQVGWAFQLQNPGVVAVLVLLATAITANFAGLYELPGLSVSRSGASAGTVGGAFGTGLLAAFVATPCTGPFMAAAMGVALVLPPLASMAVFAALGLGLALPFLLIGFVPPLRRILPRPGPWMDRFRRAMAVPMGLTVAALLWLAWRQGGWGLVAAATILAIVLLAMLALAERQRRQGRRVTAWVAPLALALVAAALFAAPRLAARPATESDGLPGAQPFSQATLDRVRASGKPVFLYFTADWCLSCKVNESVAIDREATAKAFAKAGVQVIVGDWTRADPAITTFLTTQGAAGVPLYLWYAPGAASPAKLPQVLTPQTLPDLAAKTQQDG
ncbi:MULTISPECIES: protein-disulfide reductase DsbD domain-containing protein [unclassified Sphingomonas]|uniref:protein-disulfide reductase DsbD family protein n=1 Tax=Novosphingobium rhizosphaerae TaxID=1551649 RepID=UPI0015C6E927